MPMRNPPTAAWLVQRAEVRRAVSRTTQKAFADAAQSVLSARRTGTLDDVVETYVASHMGYLTAEQQEVARWNILAAMYEADGSELSTDEQLELQDTMAEKAQVESLISNVMKNTGATDAAIAANLKD